MNRKQNRFNQLKPHSGRLVAALILAILPLLFINFGLTSPPPARFLSHLFNFAHVPLFILISLAIWLSLSGQIQLHRNRLLFCLTSALLFGIAIELLQSYSGRSASLTDLRLDLLGIMLFLSLGPKPESKTTTKTIPNISSVHHFIRLLVIAWTLFELIPLWQSITDYSKILQQPALLSDFETSGQSSRWSQGRRSALNSSEGAFALHVDLSTERYSGSTLEYLPRNWLPYRSLHIDLYNGDEYQQQIHIKIRDSQAVIDGDHYSMRFDTEYTLSPGWNTVTIALQEVAQAPQQRQMDLQNIFALTLFQMNRTAAGFMLIDNVRLTGVSAEPGKKSPPNNV